MYNLFISHSWRQSKQYDNLINLLDNNSYFKNNYRDYSVPKDDRLNVDTNAELEKGLEEQIKHASVVIIIAGVYGSYDTWVNEEVKIAKRLNKKILAVEPYHADRVSQYVVSNADKVVKWNGDSIIAGVKELARDE